MRLFIAVDFEPAVRESLLAFSARARSELERRSREAARAIKWVGEDQLHLTLHFLGEVDEPKARLLASSLAARASQQPFEVDFGQIGWFPETGPPRVVWLDITRGTGELSATHAEAGRRLTALGFALEARPFRPHLTLGRVKRPVRAGELHVLSSLAGEPTGAVLVDHATLYQSVLTPSGPVYTALARMPLSTP
jgi:2'-5' RNA ligase